MENDLIKKKQIFLKSSMFQSEHNETCEEKTQFKLIN
jgi:hypothetical protein